MSARRRWLRWLGRGLLLGAALPVAFGLALLLVLGTGWGRAWTLDALLTQVNQRIVRHFRRHLGAAPRPQ